MRPAMWRRWSTGLLTVIVLAVSACDGGEGGDGDGGEGGDGEAATLTTVDFAFDPETLTVPAGSEVRFVNEDDVAHTVTAEDGSFDVQLEAGSETTMTFDSAGSFPFVCSIHPAMTGELVVE